MPDAYIHLSTRTDESDSLDDHDDFHMSRQARSSGACVHCKSLKVRCEPVPGRKTCKRCEAGNLACVPRTRKKRKPAPTQDDLRERSNDQDRTIQDLLLQWQQIQKEQKVRSWMTHAQPANVVSMDASQSAPYESGLETTKREESDQSEVYKFFQSPQISAISPPDIVKYCPLHPDEILDLFGIYWERINPFFSLLDQDYHTSNKLIWTSPFLFTVICAVASRYYTKKPNLYSIAMEFARDAAGRALVEGSKTIDICQAYMILAVYPVPKKKWADDRSWLLIGLACRMALELELNVCPDSGLDKREQLNRTRTWLNCFCVDGSHSIQFGKMPMLRLDDHYAQQSDSWYKSSPLTTPYDIHLCGYVQIIIIMARWRKQSNEGGSDHVPLAVEFDHRLSTEVDRWVRRYAEESNHTDISRYRGNTTQLITAYLRLVVLSFGFQHAFKAGICRDQQIVQRSMEVARLVIGIMTDRLYPAGHLRYAMEAHFLYVAFAAAFLINFLRPKFLPLLREHEQQEIVTVVQRLINVLGSDEVALDYRHTPALYSKFLSNQLERYNPKPYSPTSSSPTSGSPSEGVRFLPQYNRDREPTPPHGQCAWPDIDSRSINADPGCITPISAGDDSGMIYQRSGDADMDFSINHFVSTVSTQDVNSVYAHQPSSSQLFDWNTYEGTTYASPLEPQPYQYEGLWPQQPRYW